jgi:glutamate/tyrosine decarboxylase-like PLP-dependent enzyme
MWHAPSAKQAVGTVTTGSSEAAQLGGLAMKRLWQVRRKAAGKSIHEPGQGNAFQSNLITLLSNNIIIPNVMGSELERTSRILCQG